MRENCKKMALILTFGCMAAAFTGCNGPGAAEVYHQMPVMNKQKQSETIFATVMRGDLKEEKAIRLSAKAGQKSSLSFQISDIGYDAFYVTAGDKVKKGQILARLDCEDLLMQKQESSLALEEAQIRLSMQKGLFDQYAMSKADYERTVADLQNEIEVCQQEIAEYDVLIDERTIYADMDGYVKSVANVDLSQTSEEGREMISLNGGEMEYTASVPDMAGLEVGREYEMVAEEQTILVKLQTADRDGGVYQLVFVPDDPTVDSGVITSGAITYVTYELTDVCYVDQQAVTNVGETSYVYYEENGTRKAKQVKAGPKLNGYYVITDGVKEGEELICD